VDIFCKGNILEEIYAFLLPSYLTITPRPTPVTHNTTRMAAGLPSVSVFLLSVLGCLRQLAGDGTKERKNVTHFKYILIPPERFIIRIKSISWVQNILLNAY
jgi:hypothetical protein